jgi:hypothetical protein
VPSYCLSCALGCCHVQFRGIESIGKAPTRAFLRQLLCVEHDMYAREMLVTAVSIDDGPSPMYSQKFCVASVCTMQVHYGIASLRAHAKSSHQQAETYIQQIHHALLCKGLRSCLERCCVDSVDTPHTICFSDSSIQEHHQAIYKLNKRMGCLFHCRLLGGFHRHLKQMWHQSPH